MTGYILVDAEQYYEEPFTICNMQYLQRDETFREISDLALFYFVRAKTIKDEWNKFQIVRLFKNDDTGSNYNVFVGEFRIDYEIDYSNFKTTGLEYTYYLDFISDFEGMESCRYKIENNELILCK